MAPNEGKLHGVIVDTGSPGLQAFRGVLSVARETLQTVLSESSREIEQVAGEFRMLAAEVDAILEKAAGIVARAESQGMLAVLPLLQSLGASVRKFTQDRLTITAEALSSTHKEAALLQAFSVLTHRQKGIVRQTEMLRVLTRIEVARLGEVGSGFEHLAGELDDFATTTSRGTRELTGQTQARRAVIEELKRALTGDLQRHRQQFSKLEDGLESALARMSDAMEQLRRIPASFQNDVADISRQVAGVVAAIQGHDISRQQTEHVCAAFELIASYLDQQAAAGEIPTGLRIQHYQLRNIRETVQGWTSQILVCLEMIAQITDMRIGSLGAAVLGQEREISAQLDQLGQIERGCEAGEERLRESISAMSALMELVRDHLDRSRSLRDRLQILTFNSIVEASHLGNRADGILEISKSVKRLSSEWNSITGQSEESMHAMEKLLSASSAAMQDFTGGGKGALRAAQKQTASALESLHEAAAEADARSREIASVTESLRSRLEGIGGAANRIEALFARLDNVLGRIEAARKDREAIACGTSSAPLEEIERIFGAHYTTEMEREILRAAFRGEPMPAARQEFAGNDVELF